MDVVLHCGAHRTGGAGLHDYIRRNATVLRAQGIDTCGPEETRRGLFAGIAPCATARKFGDLSQRTAGRIALRIQRVRSRQADTLLVSDPNLLGPLDHCLREGRLYPKAAENMRKYDATLQGNVRKVVVSIRSLEAFWVSAFASAVASGAPVPTRAAFRTLAFNQRSWRDVLTEISKALPKAELLVLPFESYRGRPERFLENALDCSLPMDTARTWLNRAPQLPELRRRLASKGLAVGELPFGMGPWNPFCAEEVSALRERYADDMMWLIGGADGMASLTEDVSGKRVGTSLPSGNQIKGQSNAIEERHMARPG